MPIFARRDSSWSSPSSTATQNGYGAQVADTATITLPPEPTSRDKTTVTLPPEPNSIEETGLNISFLADLLLKHIYFSGVVSGQDLADEVKLPFINVVDQVLVFLRDEELVDIIGSQSAGYSERAYEYTITSKGRVKAHEVLDRSQYVGPAPVSIQAYLDAVQAQALGEMVIDEATIREAFEGLVIS